ncbi:Elongation factor 2 [Spironucleus salmonicida]|uniref:Elongation factor 2 n=1 Tax=Spironucleus salmonicida TaxID=348837 RepID=V6LC42_9EUKA|nr:Elongation factor 2 [Spironucleus salmonicida]|eukprot:EST42075.1 Elongation factor 2 [Spironucleus salmonicida]
MTLDLIQKLQGHSDRIFNFTICAHIDHGKTSLSDSLLASNDLVNHQQAGELRTLDFLPLEQQRCITMKSSAVSLVSVSKRFEKPYPALFHLFDSPGHCDFQSEVLQALALSDSALLLVDIVESVSSQTRAIMKMLKQLNINIILGLNKTDRLFCELQMSSVAVFDRILEVIAEVNQELGTEYFDFAKNVIICSGIDKWGFDCYEAAKIVQKLAPQLGSIQLEALIQKIALPNTILTETGIKQGSGRCLMTYVLEIIENAYKKPKKTLKLVQKLNLSPPQIMQQTDLPMWLLQTIFALSQVVFDQIIQNNICKPNLYIQKLYQITEIDSILAGLKQLDKLQINSKDVTDNFLAIVRVVKNDNLQLQLDRKFYTEKGELVQINNIYQPFGKYVRITQTNCYSSGCLIVIGTDVQLCNNSILYQVYDEEAEVDGDGLGDFSISAKLMLKGRRQVVEINADQIQVIGEKVRQINFNILKYQKPLITVTLFTELFSEFGKLSEVLAYFAKYDNSCSFQISSQGELQLSVCGDVHLDLCIENITKLAENIRFVISDSTFKIKEVPVNAQKNNYLKKYPKLTETLLENQNFVYQSIFSDDTNALKRQVFVKNIPVISNYLDYMPLYYEYLGLQSQNQLKNDIHIQGLELLIMKNELNTEFTAIKYNLEAFVLPTVQNNSSIANFDIIYEDKYNNKLFMSQNLDNLWQLIIKHAFISNINSGPLCLEQIENLSIFISLNKQEMLTSNYDNPTDLYQIISSQFSNYFLTLRPSITSSLASISYFIRCTITQSNLRISEPHLITVISTPLNVQQSSLQVLQKFNAKQINFNNFTQKTVQIQAFIPVRFGLVFPREMRSAASGQAEVEFLGIEDILLEEDPRRGLIGEDDEVEWGVQGKHQSEAELVVVDILMKKGLIVEDIVEDAEKQRTIAKKR